MHGARHLGVQARQRTEILAGRAIDGRRRLLPAEADVEAPHVQPPHVFLQLRERRRDGLEGADRGRGKLGPQPARELADVGADVHQHGLRPGNPARQHVPDQVFFARDIQILIFQDAHFPMGQAEQIDAGQVRHLADDPPAALRSEAPGAPTLKGI